MPKGSEDYGRAYDERWWPQIVPEDYPGEYITDLYTEYKFNDYSWGASDAFGPIPPVNGGFLSKIPVPNLSVIMIDATEELPRHKDGNNLLFLDGHVERLPRFRYRDPQAGEEPDHRKLRDHDVYRNRPYWCWGLTKRGFDGEPG